MLDGFSDDEPASWKITVEVTTHVQRRLPEFWAVVKDGQILAANHSPFRMDGIEAIRYVPAQG